MFLVGLLIPPHPNDARTIILDVALAVAVPTCVYVTLRRLWRMQLPAVVRWTAAGPAGVLGILVGYAIAYMTGIALICTLDACGLLHNKG